MLDLCWAGAGIGGDDGHEIQIELGKDLLLDLEADEQSSEEEERHQEIGRDWIADHPGDRALLGGRGRHGVPFC